MRIGIDIGPLTPRRTGVGNYCYYLLKQLCEIDSSDSFHGLATGRQPIVLDELEGRVSCRHIPIPTRAVYKSWEWTGWPKADTLLDGVDIFHATNYVLGPVASAKTVVTVHDLAFLIDEDWCSPKIVGPFASGVGKHCHRADAVMAYSESTKRDLVRLLDVDPEKIHVAPMAVDEAFTPVPRDEALAHVHERCGFDGPFFLFVSTLEPRKNVEGLIRIFNSIAGDLPHKLLMIGGVGWRAEPILRAIEASPYRDRIIRPGFVPHMDLPAFFSAADALLFPTHYEGFGLPLLEALTCGCPVVAGDNSSVPEVTGDAALLCDEHDEEAFANLVRTLVSDAATRGQCIARGFEHAKKFSWRSCAETTLGVYRSIVS